MIANSSINHKAYVILGVAALTQVGFQGAPLVMPMACTAACCSAWSGWTTSAPIRVESA